MKTANRLLGKVTTLIVDDTTSVKESQIHDTALEVSSAQNLAAQEMLRRQNEMIARMETKKERALMKGKCSF